MDVFGKISYESVGNVNVLRLRGSPYDIGFAHGFFLRDYVLRGSIGFFRDFMDSRLDASLGKKSAARYAAGYVLEKFFRSKIRKGFRKEDLNEMEGISKGAGLNFNDTFDAALMPDLVSVILGLEKRVVGTRPPAYLGCSSFVVSSQKFSGNSLMHCRNLDYPGMGFWDVFPVVSFVEPSDGIDYVTVSSAGIGVSGGITGMNKAGISITVNQKFSKGVGRKGRSVLSIGSEALRNSSSIDDAVSILTRDPVFCGWCFLVADAGSDTAVSVDVDNKGFHISYMDSHFLVETNHYGKDIFKGREFIFTPVNLSSSIARKDYVEKALSSRDVVSVDDCVALLGDRSIVRADTVSSVVMLPASGKVYVASGLAPVPFSDYVGVGWDPLFKDVVSGRKPAVQELGAKRNHSAACASYFAGDVEGALRHSDIASECDPSDPAYRTLSGLLRMKMGDFEKALGCFFSGIRHDGSVRDSVNILWTGKCFDLLGYRASAKHFYSQLKSDSREQYGIARAGNKNYRRRFKKSHLKTFEIDPVMCDAIFW